MTVILICRDCGEQPGDCRCKPDRSHMEKQNWLKQETVLRLQDIKVPLVLVLGLYEKLTDQELVDHHADIGAEVSRRNQERAQEP